MSEQINGQNMDNNMNEGKNEPEMKNNPENNYANNGFIGALIGIGGAILVYTILGITVFSGLFNNVVVIVACIVIILATVITGIRLIKKRYLIAGVTLLGLLSPAILCLLLLGSCSLLFTNTKF